MHPCNHCHIPPPPPASSSAPFQPCVFTLQRAAFFDFSFPEIFFYKKSIFKTLVDDASVIEEFGNSLNKLTNAQKDKVYGQAIETIKQNANNVGPIADNLTTIAKEFEAAGSKNIGEFAKKFSESLERGIKSGNCRL